MSLELVYIQAPLCQAPPNGRSISIAIIISIYFLQENRAPDRAVLADRDMDDGMA